MLVGSDDGWAAFGDCSVMLAIDDGSWLYMMHSHSAPTADSVGNASKFVMAITWIKGAVV